MIPALVEAHLQERHPSHEHHHHITASTAQDLASAEHISGHRVAKPVVVRIDGELALAVVAASERVSIATLEDATGRAVELVHEPDFAAQFAPCATGAEPPLAIFDVPIFVDAKLLRERTLLMPGGTHEDAIVLDTDEWAACEGVQPVAGLGIHRSDLLA